jgi:hypothetical protein
MEFKSDSEQEISDFESWKLYGKPKRPEHWKEGRSAYELARDWVGDGDAPERTRALIATRFPGCHLESGAVEKRTRFDKYRGEVRNHDLLVTGSCDAGNLVVGVEGKADESFGESISKQQASAQKRLDANEASKGIARLGDLTNLCFSKGLPDALADAALAGLGYQLMTGLAGTLADAKEFDAQAAVFLVHEFHTDQTDESKQAENSEQYKRFIDKVGASLPEDVDATSSWITEPIPFRGHGDYQPDEVLLSFAKMVTVRPP